MTVLWMQHGDVPFAVEGCETKSRNSSYSKEVLKQGSKGEFRERGGPGLKSGLDSFNLSDLGKALEGP